MNIREYGYETSEPTTGNKDTLFMPVASATNKGIASFNAEDFEVNNDGQVSMKIDRLSAAVLDNFHLSIEDGYLVLKDDSPNNGLYTDTDCKSVVVVTENGRQIYPGGDAITPGTHRFKIDVTAATGFTVSKIYCNGQSISSGDIFTITNKDLFIKVLYNENLVLPVNHYVIGFGFDSYRARFKH